MLKTIFRSLSRFHNDESGQGLVEYALIVGIVILAGVAASPGLSNVVTSAFTRIGVKLSDAIS